MTGEICRVSIDELRYDEQQQLLDDEEDDKSWFYCLEDQPFKVAFEPFSAGDFVEIGHRSFSVKEARRIANHILSIIE